MNHEKYVLATVSQDAFVMVNKKLARKLGFVEAGLLGELLATYRYAKQEKQFFEKGAKGPWFFLTQASVEERLGIKRREHENAIKTLVKESVIQKKKMGLPSKNYYMINWQKIVEILEENEDEPAPLSECTKRTNKDGLNVQTRLDETDELDWTKRTTIKKNLKKQNIKTTDKIFDDEEKPFSIDIFAFKEFVQEFDKKHPNTFSNELFNRIYDQMHIQKLKVITYHDALLQARYMLEFEKKEIIGDYAAFFVHGIKLKQTSPESALNKSYLKKAEQAYKEKEEKEHQERISKGLRGEPLYERKVPFYNWLES